MSIRTVVAPLLLAAAACASAARETVAGTSASVGVGAPAACPPDTPASRAWVEGYLVHSNFAAHRDSLGIGHLRPVDIQVLSDATDRAACQWMVARFGEFGSHPNWYWTAYRVGGYYAVAWRYVNTNGGFRIGLTPMLMFDAQFRQAGGFAS